MTTRLYLLRHAAAEAGLGLPDLQRDLTDEGAVTAERAARSLAKLGLRIEKGFVSPARRAARTAEIFWRYIGGGELIVEPMLAPGAEPETLAALLSQEQTPRDECRRLLVVGHMPDLGHMLHFLVDGRVSASLSFAPAAMARVDFSAAIAANRGSLVWSLKAEQLTTLEQPDLV